MAMNLLRKHDRSLIVANLEVADRFLSRLRGLIGRKTFSPGEGLLFPRCNNIHMWMMSIPIDVVFLGKDGAEWRILSTHPGLRPWKGLPVWNFRAVDTLELPAGTIERLNLKHGEVLCIGS